MKALITFIAGMVLPGALHAQEGMADTDRPLPFSIHKSKRIPDHELEEKREGRYVSGLPRFEFDPVRGWGLGGDVSLFVNNTTGDPFFPYTAYRHRMDASFFIYQNGRIRYAFGYDAPYFRNSRWRIRANAMYSEDPNAQYWGVGRATLQPLRFRDKRTGDTREFQRLSGYEANLALAEPGADGRMYADFHFNHLHRKEHAYSILAERVLLGGKLRIMMGYEALFTMFDAYGGRQAEEAYDLQGEPVEAVSNPTLAEIQKTDGTWQQFRLDGLQHDGKYMFTGMLSASVIYDTRDFEPDPSNGVLFEYAQEYVAPWLGGRFEFNKLMIQGQWIQTLGRWNDNRGRITFAGLAAAGYVFGPRINFIEMWDLSSQSESGGIPVLGGDRSLRGYREARFVAPVVAMVNLELRSRLYDFRLLRQHFVVGITPFYDFGSVWDSPAQLDLKLWKGAPGTGLRIAWNQSTILRMDLAASPEGRQLFLGLGHVF